MGRSVNFVANVKRVRCFIRENEIRSSQPTAVLSHTVHIKKEKGRHYFLRCYVQVNGSLMRWIKIFVIYETRKTVFEHISKHPKKSCNSNQVI